MLPGEEFDVAFAEAGDYTYWCVPHKGAGMVGTDSRRIEPRPKENSTSHSREDSSIADESSL